MNRYAIGTLRSGAGWIAMVRLAEHAGFRTLKGSGGRPLIFASRLDAKSAAADEVLRRINGTMRREGKILTNPPGTARKQAATLFEKSMNTPGESQT